MQPQTRLGDKSLVPADGHGKPCCTHEAEGPATRGSPDVFVNNLPAIRVSDTGVHSSCCGANTWFALEGSKVVLINNLPAHRLLDPDVHCGGMGFMIEASQDVYVGDCTETGMGQAQDSTQATVQVPPQVNVEAVPMDMEPVNVQAIPADIQPQFAQAVALDPNTLQPLPSRPMQPGDLDVE